MLADFNNSFTVLFSYTVQLNTQTSQGSAATDFKQILQHSSYFHCSSENATVKEALESVHIWLSYTVKKKWPHFYGSHCTTTEIIHFNIHNVCDCNKLRSEYTAATQRNLAHSPRFASTTCGPCETFPRTSKSSRVTTANFSFYPRDAMLARSLRQQRVRLSVCHTPVLCLAEQKQDREMYTDW